VIDELTALPKHPSEMAKAAAGDRKLRLEGGGNLLRAAQATGVRRYMQQSSGFFLKSGRGLADESESLAVDATPGVAASAQTYTELESRLFRAPKIEGIALRYGSSTVQTPGSTPRAPPRTRCASKRCRSLAAARACGRGFTATTLRYRRRAHGPCRHLSHRR
jgi:hypothetical protein